MKRCRYSLESRQSDMLIGGDSVLKTEDFLQMKRFKLSMVGDLVAYDRNSLKAPAAEVAVVRGRSICSGSAWLWQNMSFIYLGPG